MYVLLWLVDKSTIFSPVEFQCKNEVAYDPWL